jgi:hypothetical protein
LKKRSGSEKNVKPLKKKTLFVLANVQKMKSLNVREKSVKLNKKLINFYLV